MACPPLWRMLPPKTWTSPTLRWGGTHRSSFERNMGGLMGWQMSGSGFVGKWRVWVQSHLVHVGIPHNSRWRLQGRLTMVSSWNQKGCVQIEILCTPPSVISKQHEVFFCLVSTPYVSPLPSSVHSIFISFHLPPYLLRPTSITPLSQHPGPEDILEVCPDSLKKYWTPSEAAKHQALPPYPTLHSLHWALEEWRKGERWGEDSLQTGFEVLALVEPKKGVRTV